MNGAASSLNHLAFRTPCAVIGARQLDFVASNL
jgi:hypothetical protein